MIHAPLHGRDRGCKPSGILNSYLLKFCVFVWCFFFFVYSRIVYWHKDVTIAGEGLQILTYTRHSWPLSSEGSLACHAYCDTGHPFIMLILQDPWHSQLLPSVWQWRRHYLICRGWEFHGKNGYIPKESRFHTFLSIDFWICLRDVHTLLWIVKYKQPNNESKS